ncbi:MAG: TetR/AcrR family transcriptional regulator [Acidobacteriales bacterium]|nr:TetR/AcrR family transcriptional regulator [Terriglobales bacterium]
MKSRGQSRPAKGKGSRNPELTRKAILTAAVEEFANEGIAGSRTDAIARAARVNKALLYYYFKDKETLYGAVLDQVFSGLAARMSEVMQLSLPPRKKILAFAAAHFDYIAASPIYPKLVQREVMRAGRSGSPHIRRLVERYLRPIAHQLAETIHQGIASGDFRTVDPLQFLFSVVAMNVFYFGSVPVISVVTGKDPLSPERVAARRAAVLDFISAALFTKSDDHASAERSKQ